MVDFSRLGKLAEPAEERYTQLRRKITATRRTATGMVSAARGTDLDPTRYFMSPNGDLAYVINSKAACTAIKKSMMKVSGDVFFHDLHLMGSREGLETGALPTGCDPFAFTFVRDPFARIVSLYVNKFEDHEKIERVGFEFAGYLNGRFSQHDTFAEFVCKVVSVPPHLCDRHFKPQSYLIESVGRPLDLIGKVENINEDYAPIVERFGVDPLTRENKSQPYNEVDYYDLETLNLIRNYFRDDVERFGYVEQYESLRRQILQRQESLDIGAAEPPHHETAKVRS